VNVPVERLQTLCGSLGVELQLERQAQA
jgi:hypothetical protein